MSINYSDELQLGIFDLDVFIKLLEPIDPEVPIRFYIPLLARDVH